MITANKNLSLLTQKGFDNRVKELSYLKNTYNKTSHGQALESAKRIKSRVFNIEHKVFQFNILGKQKLPIYNNSVDLVLTDLPYGKLTRWEGKAIGTDPIQDFLNNIRQILKPRAVVVISADKKQKLVYAGFKRVEMLKIGKRQILFLVSQGVEAKT